MAEAWRACDATFSRRELMVSGFAVSLPAALAIISGRGRSLVAIGAERHGAASFPAPPFGLAPGGQAPNGTERERGSRERTLARVVRAAPRPRGPRAGRAQD